MPPRAQFPRLGLRQRLAAIGSTSRQADALGLALLSRM